MKNNTDDVLVIAGDMMFQEHRFDLSQLVNFRQSKSDQGDVAIYYEMDDKESQSSRGIVEICPFSGRILKFFEKPKENETESRNASVVFYCFRASSLAYIEK